MKKYLLLTFTICLSFISLELISQNSIVVTAFQDQNGNGIDDDGFVAAGLTNAELFLVEAGGMVYNHVEAGGVYTFDNAGAGLPDGNYTLQYVETPWTPAAVNLGSEVYAITLLNAGGPATDNDVDPITGISAPIVLSGMSTKEVDIDLGLYFVTAIGDLVWEDINGDGLWDGELANGIGGVTITLFDGVGAAALDTDGNIVNPVTTGAAGDYQFGNLPPGDYIVQFSLPTEGGLDWYSTEYNPGMFPNDSDADPNNSFRSSVFTIDGNNIYNDQKDAGFYVPAKIGNKVFCDENGNGIDDDGALGVQGINIELIDLAMGAAAIDADGNTFTIQKSDGTGMYEFDLVPPGNYIVEFSFAGAPPDPENPPFVFTFQDQGGDDMADSDVNPNPGGMFGQTPTIEVTSRDLEEETKWDAGVYQLITISGTIWFDDNMDNTLDGTEGGPAGVSMNLYNADDLSLIDNVLTTAGVYEFPSNPGVQLAPGNYIVEIDLSAFAGPLNGATPCPGSNDANDMVDNDDNGPDAMPATSTPFTVLSNCDPATPPLVEYVDFCYFFNCSTPNDLAATACDEISDADIICDINTLASFCAIMPDTDSGGTQPAPLCAAGGAAHNISWFAFQAYGGDYTVTVEPTGCQGSTTNQEGVQIGLYTDCTFTESVYCDPNCSTNPVSFASDLLEEGQTYYFFIDGCSSSVCSYEVSITGTPIAPDFTPTDMCIDNAGTLECVDGNIYCPGSDLNFQVQGVALTVDYSWTISEVSGGPFTGDAAPMTEDENLAINFANEGEYIVCINSIDNGCQFWNGSVCRTVIIQGLDDEEFDMVEVCDVADFDVTTLMNASATVPTDPNGDATEGWQGPTNFMIGTNMATIQTAQGCEYEQEFELALYPVSDEGVVDMVFCREDLPVTIDGTQYTEASFGGDIEFSLPNFVLMNSTDVNGCDSIVDIDLEILDVFNGILSQGICTPDGVILEFGYDLSLSTDVSFITWEWTDPNGNILPDDSFNPAEPLDNIAPTSIGSGIYTLTATVSKDGVTCTFPFTVNVDFSALLPPLPTITGSPLMICESDSVQTYVASDFGDAFNYIWDIPSGVDVISGGGLSDQTVQVNWAGNTGGIITLTGVNGCGEGDEASIDITLVPLLTPDFTVTAVVCQDSSTVITYSGPTGDIDSYMWDFDGGTVNNATGGNGPGPHEVSWADGGVDHDITLTVMHGGGCTSTETVQVVSTVAPLTPPVVNCNPNTGEVSFTWTDVVGATGYDVEVTSLDPSGNLHVGVLSGTTFTVTGLQDGETVTINLIVMTGDACQMVVGTAPGCTSQSCNAPTIALDAGNGPGTIVSLCTADIVGNIDISPTIISGEQGTGEFSGPGIVDPVAGTFDPTQANIGINTITYLFMTDDPVPCIGNQTIQIEVLQTPTASFSTSADTVCITDAVTLTYDGTAGINTSDYTITDGQTFNQSDPTFTFTQTGEQTISLMVTSDGCESEVVTRTVFVQPELEPIVVSCSQQEIDFVEFTWNDVAGATGYEVVVTNADLSVDPAFTTTSTTYMQSGLTPGDIISITVTVLTDSRCPGSNFTQMCEAKACPTFTLSYDNETQDVCANGTTPPITLQALASGGDGTGTYSWSGSGNLSGDQFDPNGLPEGEVTLFVSYNENGCEGTGSVIVNIIQEPTASFDITPDPICVGSTLDIDFTGSILAGQVLSWTVSDPAVTVAGGTNINDYSAVFNTVGTFDIMLEIENGDNCSATPAMASVTVEPELVFGDIDCSESLDEITFSWLPVDCATEYEIFIEGVSQGIQSTTTYVATGLTEGQEVELEVRAVSGCACSDVIQTRMCEARPCVQVTLDVSAMGGETDFCFAPDLASVDVLGVPTGATGDGTGSYSGTGVDPATGTFDPIAAGVGSHTIVYTWIEPEGCEAFMDSVTFNIFENPEVIAMADPIDCYDDTLTMLSISPMLGDGNYTITSGGLAIPLMSEVMEGTYDIVVVDGNNCTAETSVTVTVPAEPISTITGADELIQGETSNYSIEQAVFAGLTIDSIVWTANGEVVCNDSGCFSLSNQAPIVNTNYEVTVFYNSGCQVDATFDVEVIEAEPIFTVDIPNIISPNNDGSNDMWFIRSGDPEVMVNSVRIMDRWGNRVFEVTEPYSPLVTDIFWDGKFGETDLQPGVYVYTVSYFQDGRDRVRNGDITIVR